MVIWFFAGGGETELRGLKLFLENNYKSTFCRKTPIKQKPGPKPNRPEKYHALGQSGHSLAEQIKYFLASTSQNIDCDLILVVDDLDCHEPVKRRSIFIMAINSVLGAASTPYFIGFAKPEIESWLIADWQHTFAKELEFRKNQVIIRRKLDQCYSENGGQINAPEDFSIFNISKDSCDCKLSEVIQHIILDVTGFHYSKAEHSGRMLQRANAAIIANSCPEFKKIHVSLEKD